MNENASTQDWRNRRQNSGVIIAELGVCYSTEVWFRASAKFISARKWYKEYKYLLALDCGGGIIVHASEKDEKPKLGEHFSFFQDSPGSAFCNPRDLTKREQYFFDHFINGEWLPCFFRTNKNWKWDYHWEGSYYGRNFLFCEKKAVCLTAKKYQAGFWLRTFPFKIYSLGVKHKILCRMEDDTYRIVISDDFYQMGESFEMSGGHFVMGSDKLWLKWYLFCENHGMVKQKHIHYRRRRANNKTPSRWRLL